MTMDRSAALAQKLGLGRLFWTINEAVIVAETATGCIVLWNPAATALLGYSEAEARTLTVDALVPPRHRQRVLDGIAAYNARVAGRAPGTRSFIEFAAQHKDGQEIRVALSLSPAPSSLPAGRHVVAIARDVTHTRRDADEPYQREREAAARVDAELAAQRFALLARAGEWLVGSPEIERTLLRIADLLVPRFAARCLIDMLEPGGSVRRAGALEGAAGPGDQEAVPGGPLGLAEVLRTGEPALLCDLPEEPESEAAIGNSVMIVPMVGRDRLQGAITLVRDPSATPFNAADLAFTRQLGRLTGLALENARLLEEARAAIQVRDEFLASASHELRTPVTTIKAYAQLLQKRVSRLSLEDAAPLLEGLENIDDSASRLAVHISQLLDLSRLQAGRSMELQCGRTDLVGLARQAAAAHRRLSGRHRIRVKSSVPELIGFWDAARLEHVLGNLISNAVKFSPEGGEVQLTADLEDPEHAVLRVCDQGIGITEADLPRIFDRFYRGRNLTERMNGTGIGLASVQEIVQRHGGTVEAQSEPGTGSVFTVRLPLQPPVEAE